MSYQDYTSQQRLAHEVRILLAMIEMEEEVGPDLTGAFMYQREKIYDLIKSEAAQSTPPGYWHSEKPAQQVASREMAA
ncbi:hypothetical protein QEZ48_08385 [Aquamicrobium lusatiense]|uniref:hypothetical protein n=1 Tax=Aquamicrobium lusatiense TaxID=89772 RepID=UPI002457591A|nr:hypothetical protein [Aquamicrobium lusatiense]MDH4990847.1 hypothetical protein [Aquamicrobium lusatiense]